MIKITTKKGVTSILESPVIYPEYKRTSDTALKVNKVVLQKGKNWFYCIPDAIYNSLVDDAGMVYTIPESLKDGITLKSKDQLSKRYYIACNGISFHSSQIETIEFS